MATKPLKKDFDYQKIAPYLIIILPLVVYISSVSFGLTYFDDDMLISDNYSKLSKLSNLPRAFLSDAFFAGLSPYYRPMMNVSFIFDTIIGQGSIGVFHFMNLFYHILSCLLLFKLLNSLKIINSVSLTATLLFSLHPVIGHAVLWIPARGDLLLTVFTLTSLIFQIKYLESGKTSALIVHFISFAGALFSKESAVALPLIFLGIWFLRGEKSLQLKKFIFLGGWLILISFWFLLRYFAIDHRPDSQRGMEALLNNLPFLPESVASVLFPINLPVTPVFTPLMTFLGIIGIIFIVILYVSFRKSSISSLVFFGAFWYLLLCTPNMFVRLASANDNFEYLLHRLYLPLVGFTIMAAGLVSEIKVRKSGEIKTAIISFLLLTMAIIDFTQQPAYKDGISFWTASTNYAPQRSWFYYYFGRYYFKKKDFITYEKYLLKADSIKSYPNFHYQLGMVYFTEYKDYDKAFRYFSSALSNPGYGDSEAQKNFALFCIETSNDFAKKGKLKDAIERCLLGLSYDPGNEIIAYNLGLYLIGDGQKERAVSQWKKALALKPDFKDPYKSLAIYYLYDRKLPDSAMDYAIKYKNLGGTDDLISMIKSKQ